MTNLISDAFIQAKELVMKAMGELVADGTFPAEPVPAFNTEIPADSKNGRLISSLRADGVILSTATGSTAYSMSAGGPIIEPEMKCIEFTQICAHSLFARSMILSEDSVMKVKCHTNSGSHAIVSVDGNNVFRLSAEDTVIVSKSKYFVEIIDISGGSFFSSINKKLMQPLKESAEDGI